MPPKGSVPVPYGALGSMYGETPANSFGIIGVGSTGTVGHAVGGGHGTVIIGQVQVNGRLPPEVIKRIVRQNLGRFGLCYENGLRADPSLGGKVSVDFVIGREGRINSVLNGGSDLPDANVVACVINSFYGLSFPQPESGTVSVTYPMSFAPRKSP